MEAFGYFIRLCLSGYCWYFPVPFTTLAKCNAQAVIEVAGAGRGTTSKCTGATYLTSSVPGPAGPQGIAGPPGPIGPAGPAGSGTGSVCSGMGGAICTGAAQ